MVMRAIITDRLPRLEKALAEALDGWEDAVQYKDNAIRKRDEKQIDKLRKLLER